MLSLGNNISSTQAVEAKYSANFDGTNDYIDTGATFNSVFQGNWSVSVWVNFTDKDPSSNEYVWGSEIGTEDVIRFGQLSNQTYNFYFKSNNDAADSNSWATGYNDGDDGETGWQHFVITAKNRTGSNATQIICYQNGVLKTNVIAGLTGTNHAAFTSTNLFLGARNDDGTAELFSASKISSFAIWNAILDADAVAAIYNNGIPTNLTFDSGNYDNSSALQAYYRMGNGLFDDKANGIVHDQDNPGFGINLWDGANGDVTNWSPFGNNTVEEDDGTLKFTYVDNSAGPYIYLRDAYHLSDDLVVGATYELSITTKVNTGSVAWRLQHNSYPTYSFPSLTSTDFVTQSETFIATTAASHYLFVAAFGTGEIVWVKDITVRKLNGNPGLTSGGPTFSSDTP